MFFVCLRAVTLVSVTLYEVAKVGKVSDMTKLFGKKCVP